MPIFDVLSPKENGALTEILHKAQGTIAQDLEILLSQPVTVSRLSMDYNPINAIRTAYKGMYICIVSNWDGKINGQSYLLLRMSEAKAMCGFLMMEQLTAIRENLEKLMTEDDLETFREIANQINGSCDNGLRQSLKFDFHMRYSSISVVDFTDESQDLTKLFPSDGYVFARTVIRVSELPESFILQLFPLELIRSISALQFQEIQAEAQQREEGNLRTVLIVDTDEVSRKLLKNQLKEAKFVMLDAQNGMDALGLLRKQKVDLVILEVDMPSMDGVQVCHRIKSNPNTRKVPVMFCSANSKRDVVMRAMTSGGQDFLVKPVAKELLIQRIEKTLEKVQK